MPNLVKIGGGGPEFWLSTMQTNIKINRSVVNDHINRLKSNLRPSFLERNTYLVTFGENRSKRYGVMVEHIHKSMLH